MLAEPRSGTAAGPTVLVVGDTYVASTVARALDAGTDADDVLVVGTERGRILGRAFGGDGERIVETADRPAIRVLPGESDRPGLLRRAAERVVF